MTDLSNLITSAIPLAQTGIDFVQNHARTLLGFAILLVSIHVFKPLLTGLLRAVIITILPKLSREQRTGESKLEKNAGNA